MNASLISYEEESPGILQFHKALHDCELTYHLLHFEKYGFEPHRDFEQAVNRAIESCMRARLPVQEHFQGIFLDRQGEIIPSWRLSRTALKLVLLNAEPDHPLISRIQMELIKDRN